MIDLANMFTQSVPKDNNTALQYFSKIFSEGIVFGGPSGADASVFMVMLGQLTILYIAISLFIVIYLTVHKTYVSARDKEFAGKDDKNKLFALMMVLVFVMLAPVPGHNGLALMQYLSIKLFVAGSNLADWTSYKFLETASMVGSSDGDDGERNIRVFAFNRFIQSTTKFNCAMALVGTNGLGKPAADGSYTFGLTETGAYRGYKTLREQCQLPSGTIESNPMFKNLKTMMGTEYAKETEEDNKRKGVNNAYLNEMYCYSQQYARLVNNGYIVVDPSAATVRISPELNKSTAQSLWKQIAMDSASCLIQKNVIIRDGNNYKLNDGNVGTTNAGATQTAIGKGMGGWVALGDNYTDSKRFENGYVEGASTNSKDVDRINIDNTTPMLEGSCTSFGSRGAEVCQKLDNAFKKVLNDVKAYKWLSWTPANGAGTAYTDVAKQSGGILAFAVGLDALTGSVSGNESTWSERKLGMMDPKAMKEAGLVRGKERIKAAINVAKNMRSMEAYSRHVKAMAEKAANLSSGIKAIPGIGGVITTGIAIGISIASGAADIIARAFGSTVGVLALWVMTLVSFLDVAPKAIMGLALFTWLFQCAAFVFTAPLGLTIALIPGTRIGHDTWKAGLALMMKPFLHVLFFMLSITASDMVIGFSWDVAMGEYMDQWIGGMAWDLFVNLITGELLLQLTAFFIMYFAFTLFCLVMILRGPEEVFRILGIHHVGIGENQGMNTLDSKLQAYNSGLRGFRG